MSKLQRYLIGCAAVGLLCSVIFPGPQPLAQQVYRCVDQSGAMTFSDRPCSDSPDEEELVDVTPHQGHSSSPRIRVRYVQPVPRAGAESPQDSPTASVSGPTELAMAPDRNDPAVASLFRERSRIVARMNGRNVTRSERAELQDRMSNVDARLMFKGFDPNTQRSALSQRDEAVIHANAAAVEEARRRREMAEQRPGLPNDSVTTVPVLNPHTGRLLMPAGPNVIDGTTGEIWIRTPTGFMNPQTGQPVHDPHRSPP